MFKRRILDQAISLSLSVKKFWHQPSIQCLLCINCYFETLLLGVTDCIFTFGMSPKLAFNSSEWFPLLAPYAEHISFIIKALEFKIIPFLFCHNHHCYYYINSQKQMCKIGTYYCNYLCITHTANSSGGGVACTIRTDLLEIVTAKFYLIRDVALKTCQRWWMIGRSGERGSGISVLVARHDDANQNKEFILFTVCLKTQNLHSI